MRGGIATISHRHAVANNPSMNYEYDPSKPHSFITYLGAKTFMARRWANPLPTGGFIFWTFLKPNNRQAANFANSNRPTTSSRQSKTRKSVWMLSTTNATFWRTGSRHWPTATRTFVIVVWASDRLQSLPIDCWCYRQWTVSNYTSCCTIWRFFHVFGVIVVVVTETQTNK